MEDQELPNLDRISNLPPNIIQTILTLMPIKDAFRTSILSQDWRYHCLDIPELKFDNMLFHGSTRRILPISCKLLHVVYPILMLHQGPILEFSLYISQDANCHAVDQIIIYLSRNAPTLKKLTLCFDSAYARRYYANNDHKLMPAFFKLQQLTALKLQSCVFQSPATFKGYGRLVTLSFNNVSITAEVFQQFISICPLLKDLTLVGEEKHFMGRWNYKILACLSSVDRLCLSSYLIKCFATNHVIQQKLQGPPLVHLKHLHLMGLSFEKEISLFSALLWVAYNSPNIETFTMEMQHNTARFTQRSVINLTEDEQDCSWVILHRLRVIKITNFMNTGMDFMKLILANSPMLTKVLIVIDQRVDVHDEVKMLKELLRYPRVSTRADIRFERPASGLRLHRLFAQRILRV